MATNHKSGQGRNLRTNLRIKENKVGWNRELDSPRQKVIYFIFCRGDF